MTVLEWTRRKRRQAVERIRAEYIELDKVLFGEEVDIPAEDNYQIMEEEKPHGFVLIMIDPTVGGA